MYIVDGVAYADDAYGREVEARMAKGYDRRTAEYFASGRKQIVSVKPNDNFSLSIVFEGSETRILDCKPFLKEGTVFAPFMDLDNFKRVYLDDCRCVAWDIDPTVDSELVWSNKVDLCPDTCYMDSVPARQ